MARRHAAPDDFALVDQGSDPTPGDPDLIQGVLQRYSDIGEAAGQALDVLRKGGVVATGRGSAMDKLVEMIGDDLPDKLNKTATSYRDAAQAYRDYIPRLQEAQETFDRAVDQAQAAAPQAAQAAPAALPPDASEADRAAARRTEDAIGQAQGEMTAARGLAEQARAMREGAQRQCEDVLDRAASEAIPERNIFQKIGDFFKEFPFVEILLGLLIAVVSVFFPVVGALLGGILFLATQLPAILSGDFQLGDLLVGLVSLIPGGALLRAGGGVARGVRGLDDATELANLGRGAGRSVDGPLDSIGSQAGNTRAVGPDSFRSEVAGSVGEEVAAEGINQAASGQPFDPAALAAAGAVGLVGAGAAGTGGRRGSGGSQGSGESRGNGDGTRSLDGPDGAGPSGSGSGTDGNRSLFGDEGSGAGRAPAPIDQQTLDEIQASAGPNNPLVFRDDNDPLFREDTRRPNQIFGTGFEPRDPTSNQLPDFLRGNEAGNFVSTTRLGNIAVFPRGPNGELVRTQFLINSPGGIDVPQTFSSSADLQNAPGTVGREGRPLDQGEVTFVGGVPNQDVIGARPFVSDLFGNPRFGQFQLNPSLPPDRVPTDAELDRILADTGGRQGTLPRDELIQSLETDALNAERRAGGGGGGDTAGPAGGSDSDSLGGSDRDSDTSSEADRSRPGSPEPASRPDSPTAAPRPDSPVEPRSFLDPDSRPSSPEPGPSQPSAAQPEPTSFLDLDSDEDPGRSFLDLDSDEDPDRSFLNLDDDGGPGSSTGGARRG